MANLYDILSDEDKRKVDQWTEERKYSKHAREIPPELYTAAELGYYYGWEAKVAFARGYIIGIDDDGKLIKIPYTFKEAVADVRAARKVKYRQIIDSSEITVAANISSRNDKYAEGAVRFANKVKNEIKGDKEIV